MMFIFFLTWSHALGSTEFDTCKEIFKLKKQQSMINPIPLLKMLLLPRSNTKYKHQLVHAKTIVGRVKSYPNFKNYIFSIMPSDTTSKEFEEELAEHLRLEAEIKKSNKNISKLFETKTYSECENERKKLDIDMIKDDEIIYRLSLLKKTNNYFGHKSIEQQVKRVEASGRLNAKWVVVKVTKLNELLEIIKKRNTGHIIIVAHATKSGSLMDSSGNVIPSTLFDQLSPSVKSINIFSCYGKKIDKKYGFANLLKFSRSYFSKRSTSIIEDSSEMDRTPIENFWSYLYKIDRRLSQLPITTAKRGKEVKNDVCSVNVSTKYPGDNYILKLNKVFIASVSSQKREYTFPCHLKQERNLFKISSGGYHTQLTEDDFNLSFEGYAPDEEKKYRDDNGKFDMGKFYFD